jgi:DNA-binding response OmpR family regulator
MSMSVNRIRNTQSEEPGPASDPITASLPNAHEASVEAVGGLVLVVEDEPVARVSIRAALLKGGFRVMEAGSGEAALGLLDQTLPEAVLLDIGLPGLDGFEVCRAIRERREDIAVLMLTARGDSKDKITGLDLGADDYLVKPFNPGELVARIRAVLRRSTSRPHPEPPLVLGDMRLDFQTQQAFKRGVDVSLTPREFALLAALMKRQGQVLSREQLSKEVWGAVPRGTARTVDVFVRNLREKVEDDPARPHYVKTEWGKGYFFG